MTNLYALAADAGIEVIHEDIPVKSIKALYCEDQAGSATIVMDKSLCSTPTLERCVLAEELGHYYTAQGAHVIKLRKFERDRAQIRRNEHQAVRWAVKKLIPLDEFLDAFTNGIEDVWELAEHFDVTEDYIRMRFTVFQLTGK